MHSKMYTQREVGLNLFNGERNAGGGNGGEEEEKEGDPKGGGARDVELERHEQSAAPRDPECVVFLVSLAAPPAPTLPPRRSRPQPLYLCQI
jgi:hypothetical protein